jgi:hypothetical protein
MAPTQKVRNPKAPTPRLTLWVPTLITVLFCLVFLTVAELYR